jgi:hypothetical protein
MRLASERVLERLLANETCHGAVFVSYSFDPSFFEQQVLHGLLRLTADPVEETPRFLDEARAQLIQTPIACIVDASMRQAGRRLPYDLLEVHRTTFHPKLALLLYGTHARLLVGSGNLTRAGHGGQSELFFQRHLAYDVPEAVGLLQAVMQFLDQAAAMARCRGTQLDQVRDEIARRTRQIEPAEPTDIAFLTSVDGPILPRFLALVPDGWKIGRVSLLAPFHEQDDAQVGHVDELHSVLATFTGRTTSPPEVELGVAWEDAPLGADGHSVHALEEHLGGLWGRLLADDAGKRAVDYFLLDTLTEKQACVRDRRGTSRRWSRAELTTDLESGRLFPVAQPTVHGPAQAARLLQEQGLDITLALHPAQRYEDGRACRRPLHAKLYLVEASRRGTTRTWALMGSANASRPALLHGTQHGGNVEATIAFVLDGSYRLADFAPELVHVPLELVKLEGRDFPPASPNLGAWIEEAVFRTRTAILEVRWAPDGPAPLGPWVLRYRDQAVAEGEGPPHQPTCVTDFALASDAAELSLETGGGAYSIPILVDDLAALPVSPALAALSLRELLALLGRRIGVERLETLRRPGSKVAVGAVLEHIFGQWFGTVDVFKAWWGLVAELAKPDQSFAAFRLVIEGQMGARAVWDKLRDAAGGDDLSREEAWFYGAELRRTLAEVELPEVVDRPDRAALLRAFLDHLARDLEALRPDPAERTWLEPILSFYGGES